MRRGAIVILVTLAVVGWSGLIYKAVAGDGMHDPTPIIESLDAAYFQQGDDFLGKYSRMTRKVKTRIEKEWKSPDGRLFEEYFFVGSTSFAKLVLCDGKLIYAESAILKENEYKIYFNDGKLMAQLMLLKTPGSY